MRQNDRSVEDPLLRQAVLDLFRASNDFRAAYRDFERTGDERALRAAQGRIDAAREHVSLIQSPRER